MRAYCKLVLINDTLFKPILFFKYSNIVHASEFLVWEMNILSIFPLTISNYKLTTLTISKLHTNYSH